MPKLRVFRPRRKVNQALPSIQECSEERYVDESSCSLSSSSEEILSSTTDTVSTTCAEILHRFVTVKCVLLNLIALACIACIFGVTFQLKPSNSSGEQTTPGTKLSEFIKRTESFIENELDFRSDEIKFQSSLTSNHFQDRNLESIHLPEYGKTMFSSTEDPVANAQPVFWVANSNSSGGSKALKDTLTYCMNLIISSDASYSDEKTEPEVLVFNTEDNLGHFANANTETKEGLVRANEIGLVESEIAHVLSTPFLVEASALFQGKKRTGRIFTLLQNPVDQSYSDFLYRKNLPSTHTDYISPLMTIDTYTQEQKTVSNPLTRALLNANDDEILEYENVLIAKRLLLERVIVGLVERFDESVDYFTTYFGWDLQNEACLANFEANIADTQTSIDIENSPLSESDRRLLANWHSADMELYELGKAMFEHRLQSFDSKKALAK